jgi:hypothetical protein
MFHCKNSRSEIPCGKGSKFMKECKNSGLHFVFEFRVYIDFISILFLLKVLLMNPVYTCGLSHTCVIFWPEDLISSANLRYAWAQKILNQVQDCMCQVIRPTVSLGNDTHTRMTEFFLIAFRMTELFLNRT